MKKVIYILIALVFVVFIVLLILGNQMSIDLKSKRRIVIGYLYKIRVYSPQYFEQNGGYAGICQSQLARESIRLAEGKAKSKVECNDSPTSFAVQVLEPAYWCIDLATGGTSITKLIPGATTCGQ